MAERTPDSEQDGQLLRGGESAGPADGKLILVTAPSGAGKTTIVRYLLRRYPELAFSVSATTRKRREYETDGRDYYFLSPEAFERRRGEGDFLETEEVYPGVWYGTLRMEVERLWRSGRQVIFDVDVKGALVLKGKYPGRSLSIFVAPPSMDDLESRLRLRKTENEESLRIRIARAREEMLYADRFDYRLVNDSLDRACAEAEQVVGAFLHSRAVENMS